MRYSAEFIVNCLKLVENGERVLVVARLFGVSESSINNWRKWYKDMSLEQIKAEVDFKAQAQWAQLRSVSHITVYPGYTFQRLTAIKLDRVNSRGEEYWLFQCECGKQKSIRKTSVTSHKTYSCGCLQKEMKILFGLKPKEYLKRLKSLGIKK